MTSCPAVVASLQTDSLRAIVRIVGARTGHDLSLYKPGALRRGIERRMSLHGAVTFAEYGDLLDMAGQEADLLCSELLIGVTTFLRDPAAWEIMRDRVLRGILARAAASPGRELRAWVVGCSTGEEAYTLAMLVCEALDHTVESPLVQIFASDVNADAIDVARRGFYPSSITNNLSADQLARYFKPAPGGHDVVDALRSKVVFVRHDVVRDPPFSRLDIIVCRNVMIYFEPALQRRLSALLHWAGRPRSCLMLGPSETVDPEVSRLFEPVDADQGIYMRSDTLDAPVDTAVFPVHSTAAVENLLSSNEELRSTIEELRCVNDELNATRERTQRLNRRLHGLNRELMDKLDELALVRGDLDNLMAGPEIAAFYLDGDQRVRRLSEFAKKRFRLNESHLGELITALPMPIDAMLVRALDDVARTLQHREVPLQMPQASYSARVMPYKRVDHVIDGWVILLMPDANEDDPEAH